MTKHLVDQRNYPGLLALVLSATVGVVACAPHGPTQQSRQAARFEAGTLPMRLYAGGTDCTGVPPFRVYAYNESFFVLRQAACTNFEKPIVYLIFGSERAILFDTGARQADLRTPVDTLIRNWLARHGRTSLQLIVAHSHAHSDHVAGDSQFVDRAETTIVGRDTGGVRAYFGIRQWPTELGRLDLGGGRVLEIIPLPGHQAASIAIYDARTGILLTGDTFYPGRLYVRDTTAFAESIARLVQFTAEHPVSHLLGAHIENTRTPYRDYPEGTVDQPAEHELALRRMQLLVLDSVVRGMRGRMKRVVLPDFTVWPLAP